MHAGIGETYREWALDLTPQEAEERVRVLARLPKRIVDCHVHSTNRESVLDLSEYAWRQARSSFPTWSVPDSDGVQEFLYGEQRLLTRLFMAHPFRGIDHRRATEYLLAASRPTDRVSLCGRPDDLAGTTEQLQSGKFVALKMYPHYREPPYQALDEYFPDWALEAARAAGVPAVVHLPRPLGECWPELLDLVGRNPGTRLVLAHLGRQNHVDGQVIRAFERVAELPGVFMDTSMATNREVYRLALHSFGAERILYGSDEPFNLLRYTTFRHPTLGPRLMSPRRYHWLDEAMFEEYQELARNTFLVHLQVLRTLLDAIDEVFGADRGDIVEGVFHANAFGVFPLVRTP